WSTATGARRSLRPRETTRGSNRFRKRLTAHRPRGDTRGPGRRSGSRPAGDAGGNVITEEEEMMESGAGIEAGRPGRPRLRRALAAIAVVAVAALSVVAAGGARSNATPNWTVKLAHGGTFTLAPSIAAKVQAGKPINYVFSYQSCVIQGFS